MKVVEKVCAGFWYHVYKIKTTMQTALDLQTKFVLSRSTPTIVVGGGGGEGGLYWHKVWTTMTRGRANNERSHERKQVTRVRTRYMVTEYRTKVQTLESIHESSRHQLRVVGVNYVQVHPQQNVRIDSVCTKLASVMSWGPAQLSCWWQRGYVGRLRKQSNFESVQASKGSGSKSQKD